MKRSARFRLSGVAALAFALAAGVVWWVANRVRGTVRLPDGREVTVLAVTYGTNHTLIEGPLWAKAARRFVARPTAHKLGLRIYERRLSEPTLILWTHWRLPSTNAAPRYASLIDRHGVESEPVQAAVDAPVGGTDTAIMAWQFTSFPRRQAGFPIRFYDRESGRLRFLGEAPVSNIVPPDAPSGNATSPPVTVTRDDIEFTLTMFRSGGEVPTDLIAPSVQVAAWTEARLEVRERGRLATNWSVRNLRAVGESGNRFQLVLPAWLAPEGDYRVAFPGALWPDEPGWRIHAEFARTSGFVETNRWVLLEVPAIPNRSAPATNALESGARLRPGAILAIPTGRNPAVFTKSIFQDVPGARIDTVELRPTTPSTRYVRGGIRRTTDLAVSYSPATERMHLDLAAVTDNLGREVRFSRGIELSKGQYLVGLEVSTNSATLDLTFVIHQSREVEFFVKPDGLTNNAAQR